MITKVISIALLIVFSIKTLAAQAEPNWRFNGKLDPVPLCSSVEAKVLENDPRHDTVLYMYQSEIYDAAGVVEADSQQAINGKVRKLLNANMPKLLCNTINFNPRNGNLLKLAVARQSDSFIDWALSDWQLDLNQVDETDGKTVLDYITQRREQAGPTFAKTLTRYHDRFRKAGAKTSAELLASGHIASIGKRQADQIAELSSFAVKGNLSAALELSRAYQGTGKIFGQLIPADSAAATRWQRRAEAIATASGTAVDAYWIAGFLGIETAPAKAALWLQKAADQGHANSQFELGRLYALGQGVPRDLNRALDLMRKANGQDLTVHSLLWAGSISGWLGRRTDQIGWYRRAWQQNVRMDPVPGFAANTSPGQSPLQQWFRTNGISECGKMIDGGQSC